MTENFYMKQNKTVQTDRTWLGMAVIEYGIAVYTVLATMIHLLNYAGIIDFQAGFMKATFFGPGLLILLVLEHEAIRPYIMGIMAADIVAAGSQPLFLLLIGVCGYFLLCGTQIAYRAKEWIQTLLTACVGMEVYSVAGLIQGKSAAGGPEKFLTSFWVDVLFVLAAAAYGIVDYQSERKTRKQKKYRQILQKKAPCLAKYAGMAVCVISLGLFAFYFVLTRIGSGIIAESTEEVYVAVNEEDSTLALTVTEDEETGTCLSYEVYEGKNNQKIRRQDLEDGVYQYTFLSSGYVLDAEADGAFRLERTIADEYTTHLVSTYYDMFTPTVLMEVIYVLIGSWTWVVYVLCAGVLCAILYLRKITGEAFAFLSAVIWMYLLAYGAVSVMALFAMAYAVCVFIDVVNAGRIKT
jgi:hypothetical protein